MRIYNEEIDPNILGLDTEKKDLIEKIKDIIEDYGEFGVGEVQADCSPTLKSNGNLNHLVEKFNKKSVTVEVYGEWENSIDTYNLDYEELDEDVLRDIIVLCDKWIDIVNDKENDFVDGWKL